MNRFFRLASVPYAAGEGTAGKIKFDKIPVELNGRNFYVRSLRSRLTGVLTNGGGSGYNGTGGDLAKLFGKLNLAIPDMPRPLVNVRGIDFARMHRLRNRGRRMPGTGDQADVAAAGTLAVDLTFPILFADPLGRRSADGEIPAKLLRDATYDLDFAADGALGTSVTFAGNVETVAEIVAREELVVPALSSIEASDLVATDVEPDIARVPGKITHLFAARQNGALWASTDWAKLGLAFGTEKVSEDSQNTGIFYDSFNESAMVEIAKHTAAGAVHADDFLPLIHPPNHLQGQRITYECADGRLKSRWYANVAAAAYTIGRRVVWEGDKETAWVIKAAELLGIPASRLASARTQTASHKGTNAKGVEQFVPIKL